MFTIGNLEDNGSGLIIEPRSTQSVLSYIVNPVAIIALTGFSSFFALGLSSEVLLYSSAANNLLRETLGNFPGVGPLSQRTVIESQIIVDNNTAKQTQNSTRERDRSAVSICPIIHVTSYFYFSQRDLRTKLLVLAQQRKISLPEHFSQNSKRIRQSTIGKFLIVPTCNTTEMTLLVTNHPELKNTFFDPAFLATSGGMNSLLDFFSRIQFSEGNYISFVDVTPQNFPDWEANKTTTFTGVTVNKTTTGLNRDMFVLSGTSYPGNVIPATHLSDATIVEAVYEQVGNPFVDHRIASENFTVQGTSVGLIDYMTARSSGKIKNPHKPKNHNDRIRGNNQDYASPKDETSSSNSQPPAPEATSVPTFAKGRKFRGTEAQAFKHATSNDYLILIPTSAFGKNFVKSILNGLTLSPRPRGR